MISYAGTVIVPCLSSRFSRAADTHGAVEFPVSMRRTFRCTVWYVYLEIVESIGDLSVASGKPIVQADEQFGPISGVLHSFIHW